MSHWWMDSLSWDPLLDEPHTVGPHHLEPSCGCDQSRGRKRRKVWGVFRKKVTRKHALNLLEQEPEIA